MLKVLVLFLSLLVCLPGYAQAEDGDPEPRVNAGVFHFDGFHNRDEKGNFSGYGIDLLRLISGYSHLNFNYKGYENSWEEMQEMLRNGEIDLVSSARYSPSRSREFAFSNPVGNNITILSARADNNALMPGNFETYDGITIGLLAGSSQNRHLENFAQTRGFTYKTIEFEDPMEMTQALQTGVVDAVLSSNLRKSENEKELAQLALDNFYIIVRKEDQALLDEINYAIEQMNANEGDWSGDLFYRYYGPEQKPVTNFTPREKAYIQHVVDTDHPVTAIARGHRKPYSYVEDGELKGIIPDFFSTIMNKAGIPFTFIVPNSIEEYKDRVSRNGVDVVLDRIHTSYLDMEQRDQGFTTDPYLVSGVARVTRQDFQPPAKVTALVEETTLSLPEGLLDGTEIRTFPTGVAAMEAVAKGEADAAYVLPYTAQLYTRGNPDDSVYYTLINGPGTRFQMYVPADVPHELHTILNKSIRTVPEDTLSQISAQYTLFNLENLGFRDILRANPKLMQALILISAAVILLLVVVIGRYIWNRRLLQVTEEGQRKLEEQLAIVEALSQDYTNVYAFNEDANNIRTIKLEGYLPDGVTSGGEVCMSYQDLVDKYVESRVHPEDKEYLKEALNLGTVLNILHSKKEYTGSYRVVAEDGIHHYQFTFVLVGEDNPFILCGFRNIDEMISREQAQKEILAKALAQARYASAAKTNFLNNMSHDIRTPMNAIMGFTNLASAHLDDPQKIERYLGKILTSGNHLLSLINDVLDMSRIESGKVKIDEKECNLPDVLHDLKTIVQSDIRSKQLNFQLDAQNVVDEVVLCDRLRLNQVLLNVLGNAMKYTNAGGTVMVRVSQSATEMPGISCYEFQVQDTGIGMSKEFLAHVFEPFEREQTSTVSGIQGTGLGLAITKNIVEMMGGEIWVESELGKGSTFTIRLYLRVAQTGEQTTIVPHLEGKKALVVDDDVNSCIGVSKMLATMGMDPDWTTLGKEAIVRTRFTMEQEDSYSAYILDWMMPDTNGIELARQIRKLAGDLPPIILLTAYDWTEVEEEAKEAGITAICAKPVFLSKLREILLQGASSPPSAEEETNDAQFVGKHVLLAEDNEMNQEIAQMILEGAGFVVDIVDDGSLAVKRMEELPAHTYDLILMDVQMPIMNGYEATRKIRQLNDKEKASIPIVAMTANAFDEDRERAIASGMNAHIAKPIDLPAFMNTLKSILQRHPDADEEVA